MKVIFLDIDGVLNHYAFTYENMEETPESAIDQRAVMHVNSIVEQTSADIVISSAWRNQFTLTVLTAILRSRGLTGQVVGQTPSFDCVPRGYEVEAWLRSNDVYSFVCIDDLDEFRMLPGRHVKTDQRVGLLDRHVADAVAILRQPFDQVNHFAKPPRTERFIDLEDE